MDNKRSAILVAGVALVFVGAAIEYMGTRTDWPQPNPPAKVSHHYTVTIRAPLNVTWTVWFPRPLVPTTLETDGMISALGWTNTPRGQLEAVSGRGSVLLYYANVTSQPPQEDRGPPSFDISAGDADIGYWVMRQSSDPSADIQIVAMSRTESEHPTATWSCGGSGYRGNISEGWNFVPSTGGWDCQAILLLGLPPWWVMPTAWGLIIVGAATVTLALLLWIRTRNPPVRAANAMRRITDR